MSLHAPHAAYVVAAYAVSLAGLLVLAVSSAWRARHWKRRAEAERKSERRSP